jgi:serine/threonine protein kinase
MKIASGVQLGAYQILSSLGAGGMGKVWRALDTRLDRDAILLLLGQVRARQVPGLAARNAERCLPTRFHHGSKEGK